MAEYIEKNGESIQDAIVILNVTSHFEGITAEYEYIERKFGIRGKDWELEMQSLVIEGDKFYDRMELKLFDGTRKTIYFDITSFFGKF